MKYFILSGAIIGVFLSLIAHIVSFVLPWYVANTYVILNSHHSFFVMGIENHPTNYRRIKPTKPRLGTSGTTNIFWQIYSVVPTHFVDVCADKHPCFSNHDCPRADYLAGRYSFATSTSNVFGNLDVVLCHYDRR